MCYHYCHHHQLLLLLLLLLTTTDHYYIQYVHAKPLATRLEFWWPLTAESNRRWDLVWRCFNKRVDMLAQPLSFPVKALRTASLERAYPKATPQRGRSCLSGSDSGSCSGGSANPASARAGTQSRSWSLCVCVCVPPGFDHRSSLVDRARNPTTAHCCCPSTTTTWTLHTHTTRLCRRQRNTAQHSTAHGIAWHRGPAGCILQRERALVASWPF